MIISNAVANAIATALMNNTLPTAETIDSYLAEIKKDNDRNSAKRNTRLASINAVSDMLGAESEPVTVKGFYEAHEAALNEIGITSTGSLQYLWLHEMKELVDKTEVKGKPNAYSLKA